MPTEDSWLPASKRMERSGFKPHLTQGLRRSGHPAFKEELSLVEIMARFTEHAPQGILLLDENWRITYANGTAMAEAHIQPQDLNQRIFWEMYPQVVGTILEQTYRNVAVTRKRGSVKEYHYAPFDTWADVDVLPMGRGIGVYFKDVTARVRLQAARDQANEQLDRVLSATTDSVMSVGRDWRILYMNQHGKASVANKGDILGENLWETFPEVVYDGSPFLYYHYRAMNEGVGGSFQAYVDEPMNAWYDSVVRPSREGIIIFFRDITQQKQAEAIAIENEKLSVVAQLASSIAHQINNPLACLTNLLYIAHQRAEIPEVRQYLQIAEDELRRVCSITRQSLRLHRQLTAPQAVSPTKLLTDAVGVFDTRVRNASIVVEERYRAKRPVVCLSGDVGQLLSELIGNAMAAMGSGGTLRLRSREATEWRSGRHGTVLTVSDTGQGMDAEARSRIFEAFFTTKGIGGVGLGLWIAADIAKRVEGELRVRTSQSAGGHGTVVTLFLPDRVAPSPGDIAAPQKAAVARLY